jgi:hypothetical protein
MTTRNRHGTARGKSAPPKAKASAPAAQQEHASTPDPLRQQQALSNQGSQGRMAPSWRTRFSEDDEDEDETPPTLH